MSNEIAVSDEQSLALSNGQGYWNDKQLAALKHMGVESAGEGDLMVFHHVCSKTGLDPFARQIYMIGRNVKNTRTDKWETKYTIQTGIDGFRLIGRRAADRTGQKISLSAPEWAHEDGSWRAVWRAAWGDPVGARVTLERDGEPFRAVALFDEYKQTKKDGNLTQMWAQRPAGQIAKCAEALAWRMAFPQELSGVYSDDEMAHAARAQMTRPRRAEGNLGAALGQGQPAAVSVQAITADQLKKLHTCLTNVGLDNRDEALSYYARVTGTVVASSKDLTRDEASQVIDDLERVERGEPNQLDPASANDPARDES